MYTPPEERGIEIKWKELTLVEQELLLKQGYKPPEGAILHNNLGMDDPTIMTPVDERDA